MAYTNTLKRIAIPKGRLFKQVLEAFEKSGYPFTAENDRSLVYINNALNTSLLPLKSEDVLTFVDQELCDAGILGLDILLEKNKENLVRGTLQIGKCRLSIAGKPEVRLSENRFIRVASKYPKLAKDFLNKLGMAGEVIPMNSSVEVAPLLGMADCILDIIETGATLEANGLEEWYPLYPVSSQLIIKNNKTSLFPQELERILYDISN